MPEGKIVPPQGDTLRRRAENEIREKAVGRAENMEVLSPEETRQMLHDLRVHQIELEIQNEELRRTQEKLDAARARYFDLYDLAPVGYCTFSEKGLILEVNLTATNLLGLPRSALVKRRLADFVLPDDQDIYYRHRKLLFETGVPQVYELRMLRADAPPFWARIDATVAQDIDGTPVCRATMSDVTERKRGETELKESKALVEAVVENVPLMIFLKEATDLRFVIFNRAGEELLGYDRSDLMGKNNLDLFPPEQAVQFMAKDREVLDGEVGMLDIPEESILTAKKGQRLLHTRKVCIRGSDEATKYLLGISEDITERKQAEEKLQQTLDSLRRAFSTIVQVMVTAVESRDPYTAGHQNRSADLARAIATEMGLPQDKLDGISMAGSIHDIGKMSVPAEILVKPTKLSELEFRLIKDHAQKGFEMLKDVESPWPLAEMVYQHHERMDGSGYPRGLKGEKTLIEARILAVADVVESMASHRPYRPALGLDAALKEIENNKGALYDAGAVDACQRLCREKGYQLQKA
ncbi:MAG: HD domain-containing phosphohydrolase [Syntrophus sp. (in: bacteria)]